MEDKNYYSRTGYVSNSSLNYLKISPYIFKLYIDGNLEEESKDYLRFGQLVHLRVLEPLVYETEVMVYDYVKPRSQQQIEFIDRITGQDGNADLILTQAYRAVYKNPKDSDERTLDKAIDLLHKLKSYQNYCRLSREKTIISSKESELIELIHSNCQAHKGASQLLNIDTGAFDLGLVSEYNEKEILWLYGDLKCKSLIDRIVIDKENKIVKLIDFKTSVKLHDFASSYRSFGYDRQLAFYAMAIKNQFHLFDKDNSVDDYTFEYYIIAACSKYGNIKSFKIDCLEEATKEVTELLDRAKWHIDSNKFDHSMEYYTGDGFEDL